jgi:hypothetical protein
MLECRNECGPSRKSLNGQNLSVLCINGVPVSLLEFNLRPLVEFDVSKKEHRAIFRQFQMTHSWGHNPYRFIVPKLEQFDLVTAMESLMLSYYMDKEFGKPLPIETSRKDVQKMQKMVDKKRV